MSHADTAEHRRIATAMNQTGPEGMWDEQDGFYYDVLRFPDGRSQRLKVRCMVGLLPLCATSVVKPRQRACAPRATAFFYGRLRQMPEAAARIHATGPENRGVKMTLFEVARETAHRLQRIFLRDESGRPVYGRVEKFQTDPHWRDYILFYAYFHGDSGAGLGASHQTGWTGLIAKLIEIFERPEGTTLLKGGKRPAYAELHAMKPAA
jgi:hypothetical protein